MSIRDSILTTVDIQSKLVEVPEWGVTLEVRGMTAGDRMALTELAMGEGGTVRLSVLYPWLVVSSTFDPETGERVFSDEDVEAVKTKAGSAVERLATAAMELSGMTEAARNALGEDSSGNLSDAS